MLYRHLTPDFAVAPQISPEDIATLAKDGFTTVLCNRPNAEIPADHHASVLREAAESAGMAFVENPVVHSAMTMDIISLQADTAKNGGKVLAYCASGTRSTVVWMLGQAPYRSADELIEMARQAGYQLDGLRPQLDAMADKT